MTYSGRVVVIAMYGEYRDGHVDVWVFVVDVIKSADCR